MAAAELDPNGKPVFSFGGLQGRLLPNEDNTYYLLTFDAFKPGVRFIVKGTVIINYLPKEPSVHVFEVVRPDLTLDFWARNGIQPDLGIVIRLAATPSTDVRTLGFMVEVSRYG